MSLSTSAALAAALLLVAWSRGGAQTATAPAQTPSPSAGLAALDRHEPEIVRFEAADRVRRPATGGIVLVGSSSFRLWEFVDRDFPGLPIVNRGFGGSTLAEVIHYAPRIVLPYRPRTVVVYAGDNEIAAGRSAQQVVGDYRELVSLLRRGLPQVRIVYVSIKPSPSRWRFMAQVREANRLVRDVTISDSLQTFVDVFTPMLGDDGRARAELFTGDSLHMNRRGYAIWRERLAPVLR